MRPACLRLGSLADRHCGAVGWGYLSLCSRSRISLAAPLALPRFQADVADIRGKEREQYQKALAQLNKLRADAEKAGHSTADLDADIEAAKKKV